MDGSIILYFDLSESVKLPEKAVRANWSFNVPLVMYDGGSYFGDQECLNERLINNDLDDKKHFRVATASAWTQAYLLKIKSKEFI